jgi:hypothetical protein
MRTVVEFKLFTRLVEGRLSDTDRKSLTDTIATHPDSGDLIPGAGGVRKLRWAASGRGKSGGARVITYCHCHECPIYLITIYLKKERADLTQAEVAWLYTAAKELGNAHQERP